MKYNISVTTDSADHLITLLGQLMKRLRAGATPSIIDQPHEGILVFRSEKEDETK